MARSRRDCIGAGDVPDPKRVLAAAVAALQHIHSRGIVCRDLKPANILRGADDRVKLARTAGARRGSEFVGTPQWLASEIVAGSAPSAARDWRALGVLVGDLWLRSPNRARLFDAIRRRR
jgi:serine/threonine protein kinase